MKAFILAAGLGTRLRPLTDNQPKVMVEVGGKKILERTIEQLKLAGVSDLLINTHYFPEVVKNYFGDGSKWGMKIQYSFEPEILGTAGGLKKCEDYFNNEKEFLVVYGDNVFKLDFGRLISTHQNKDSPALVALFDRTKSPNSGIAGGVVEVQNGRIIKFWEGANSNDLNLVNAGVYILKPEIFKHIPKNTYYDFGKNVFPKLLDERIPIKAYILESQEAVFGIDTMESLRNTENYFKAQL